ncbi:MAG TPA: PilZ domain-containing protein [Polyangiales bacterium]
MGEKLERVFEYRVLHSKERELQIPLSAQEASRLERLRSQLPERVPCVDDRDAFTRLTTPLPVQYVAAGRFGAGLLRNASAAGLAIATAEPPELGQRLIVHVQEPLHGLEYTFPCRVVSRVVKGTTSMGLVFEGVPSQTRSSGSASGVWRSDLTPIEHHFTGKTRHGR